MGQNVLKFLILPFSSCLATHTYSEKAIFIYFLYICKHKSYLLFKKLNLMHLDILSIFEHRDL